MNEGNMYERCDDKAELMVLHGLYLVIILLKLMVGHAMGKLTGPQIAHLVEHTHHKSCGSALGASRKLGPTQRTVVVVEPQPSKNSTRATS
jgi:hypothetical protein